MAKQSVKKNLVWNIILTISGYLFPLLTFPYITRVLGAENIGLSNFILSIMDYAILFSTFGISTIGGKFIAQYKDDKQKRNEVFNNLVTLHLVSTSLILLIYLICIFCVPQLRGNLNIYLVGITKIVFSVFLVEWLFHGVQDFRYITLRTICTRLVYVIAIFALIRSSEDYDRLVYITIGQVILNSLLNWNYGRRFVTFRIRFSGIKTYIMPFFSMGINRVLLSFYSTFIVMYLGMVCTKASVGYFSSATKIYSLILALILAYNGVFMPYLNTLYASGQIDKFKQYISFSLSLVTLGAVPIVIGGVCLAPEIIRLIAGQGFEEAVFPLQIILLQVLLVGFAQIFENQILLTFMKFNQILFTTIISTSLSVVILIFFAKQYSHDAAAFAVAIPHLLECVLLYCFARKTLDFKFPFRDLLTNILCCIPIVGICFLLKTYVGNYILMLALAILLSCLYYFIVQYYILKNEFLQKQILNITKTIKK